MRTFDRLEDDQRFVGPHEGDRRVKKTGDILKDTFRPSASWRAWVAMSSVLAPSSGKVADSLTERLQEDLNQQRPQQTAPYSFDQRRVVHFVPRTLD